MSRKHEMPLKRHPGSNLVSMAAICRVAKRVAEKFQPDQVILFGSYAYGQPRPDSDVDLLVVMPARDERSQADRIERAVDPPFRLDVHVRTPEMLRWRLKEGDWFLREIVGKGRMLHGRIPNRTRWARAWFGEDRAPPSRQDGHPQQEEPMKKLTKEWVAKAEADLSGAQVLSEAEPPLLDLSCFLCQQAAEKYFKALLQQWGEPVPRTHDLNQLLDLLLEHDGTLGNLRQGLKKLTEHAVDVRYPGHSATPGQFRSALRLAQRVRQEVEARLRPRTRKPRRRKKP